MSWIAALLLGTTAAYAGFQATIRVVVYPQFAAVPAAAFATYERRHQRLVTFVVGPLFVGQGVAVLIAFARGPRMPATLAGVALAAILLLTALGAVPQHRRLDDGFDAAVHGRLLRVDSLRLAAAVVAVAAACWYAVR